MHRVTAGELGKFDRKRFGQPVTERLGAGILDAGSKRQDRQMNGSLLVGTDILRFAFVEDNRKQTNNKQCRSDRGERSQKFVAWFGARFSGQQS